MKTTLLILVVTPHTHCRTKYARLIPFPAFPHLDLLEGTPWGILSHLDVLEHINMEFQQAVAAGGGGRRWRQRRGDFGLHHCRAKAGT